MPIRAGGTYQVTDVSDFSMTAKLTLKPGRYMSYHSHEKRDENWTVINGSGTVIIDGRKKPIQIGDFITMNAGSKHTVIAGEKGLQLMEMQIGKDINVKDKRKYEWPL